MSDVNDRNMNPERGQLVHEYMERAARARALGDSKLGLHLFLAAYGEAATENGKASGEGLCALKEAWALALQLKERSLAEYIFEKMEPSLSASEIKACSNSLQDLALDKLAQYGISRKDLEDVSDYISQELNSEGGISFTTDVFSGLPGVSVTDPTGTITVTAKALPRVEAAPASAAAAEEPAKAPEDVEDKAAPAVPAATAPAEATAPEAASAPALAPAPVPPVVPAAPETPASPLGPNIQLMPQNLRFADLAGYANAIRIAKGLGLGREKDPRFAKLVHDLNVAHGLAEPPAFDPIIITAPVREDASRFAYATAGELDLPVFRMFVEDNPQGLQMLCVASQNNPSFKFDRKTGFFEGKGTLLMEDLDLWEVPSVPDCPEEGMNPFLMAQIQRGVREVYNFIRAAVEDPNVYVLVTAESPEAIDPFFMEILEPYQQVPIEMPTAGERASIWTQLVNEHPSLKGISVAMLVKNSANMARYDIAMAVADTLDESYLDDLRGGRPHPVRPARLFEKLAAYQPLDSEEYRTLEEAIVSDFRSELSHIDDILKG